MTAKEKTHLVVGLPATGKTTFLAALWHLAQYSDVDTRLAVANLGANDEHLNELHRAWLRCSEVERSKATDSIIVEMQLTTKTSPIVSTRLHFPDLAGEIFEHQWSDRQCDKDYAELAKKATGVILFVHPQRVHEPVRLEAFLRLLEGEKPKPGHAETPEARNPARDPSATILVELLQFISRLTFSKSLRIAVVVSAWDVEEGLGFSPEDWVKKHLSLLHQFLIANQVVLPSRIFGVSAQGGDYATNKAKLLRMSDATERIKLVTSGYVGKDLTRIVHWILGNS